MSALQHLVRVNVYESREGKGFWANSPDMNGLAAAGDTRAEVEKEARLAAQDLAEYLGIEGDLEFQFQDAEFPEE